MSLLKLKRQLKGLFGQKATIDDFNHFWANAPKDTLIKEEAGASLPATFHAQKTRGEWHLSSQTYGEKTTYCSGSINGISSVHSVEEAIAVLETHGVQESQEDEYHVSNIAPLVA